VKQDVSGNYGKVRLDISFHSTLTSWMHAPLLQGVHTRPTRPAILDPAPPALMQKELRAPIS